VGAPRREEEEGGGEWWGGRQGAQPEEARSGSLMRSCKVEAGEAWDSDRWASGVQ
jgi:hypothetical protein